MSAGALVILLATPVALGSWRDRLPVADPAAVERLVDRTVQTFGRLDIAFNNAAGGGQGPTPLAELPIEAYDSALAVTLRGVFCACNAVQLAGGAHVPDADRAAMLEATRRSPFGLNATRVTRGRCGRPD